MINQHKNIYILSLFYILLFTFIGGFADASSFVIFGMFTGHITGNIILAIIHAINGDMYLFIKSVIALIGFSIGTFLGVWFRINLREKYTYSTSIALFFQLSIIIGIFTYKLAVTSIPSDIIFLSGLSFALGLQNGTINIIKKIGVHSSYITGMTTTLINKYLSLNKQSDSYSEDKKQIILLFASIISFGFGATLGVLLVYYIHFIGFIVMCILLFTTIIINMYLQYYRAL